MNTLSVDAFLADSAESVQGKIYAMGIGWNSIYAPSLPIIQSRIAMGLIIHIPYTATNINHKVVVHLEDADGQRMSLRPGGEQNVDVKTITELAAPFNLGRPPLLPAGDSQVLAIAMTFEQVFLESQGMFNWVITIDGQEMKRIPMRVYQLNQPGQIS